MAMHVGLTSDYTQLVKEYIPQGQKQSLWESFLTGTQQTYQGLAQQAQDVASYDISDAYTNYKRQQLQLQMNEQLGAGFQQQVGQQLKSQYGSAYEDIKTQEASTLYDIETQKAKALQAGEKEFTELGKQLRAYDKLLQQYAEYAEIQAPENITTTTYDEYGIATTELTDYGKMYYSDIINYLPEEGELSFQDWLLSEDLNTSDMNYEEREALWEAYRQNTQLFREQVAGLTEDFNYEATKAKYESEQAEKARANEIDTKIQNISTNITGAYGHGSDYGQPGALGVQADLEDVVNYYGYTGEQISFETGYNKNKSKYTTIVNIDNTALTDAQKIALRETLGYDSDTKLRNGKWTFTVTSKKPSHNQLTYQQLLSILKKKE